MTTAVRVVERDSLPKQPIALYSAGSGIGTDDITVTHHPDSLEIFNLCSATCTLPLGGGRLLFRCGDNNIICKSVVVEKNPLAPLVNNEELSQTDSWTKWIVKLAGVKNVQNFCLCAVLTPHGDRKGLIIVSKVVPAATLTLSSINIRN